LEIGVTDPFDGGIKSVSKRHAALACELLIRAYMKDQEHVDWSDVQHALRLALQAWRLPPNFIDDYHLSEESTC
jgi:hypothetical protein